MLWAETVEKELEGARILVAAEDLIVGEVITEASVTSVEAMRSLLRIGAVPEDELSTILGRRLEVSVAKGSPILRMVLEPNPKDMSNDGS